MFKKKYIGCTSVARQKQKQNKTTKNKNKNEEGIFAENWGHF